MLDQNGCKHLLGYVVSFSKASFVLVEAWGCAVPWSAVRAGRKQR